MITPPPNCSRYKSSVTKKSAGAALAAFFVTIGLGATHGMALQGQNEAIAAEAQSAEAQSAEERLLGSADDEARFRELLPFTRSRGASGWVIGSLADSAAAMGVPRAALVGALAALDGATGRREMQEGDRFYVRWQQTYTIDGDPIGAGRVLWLQLQTADGLNFAIHRFRPGCCAEQFFVTDGE